MTLTSEQASKIAKQRVFYTQAEIDEALMALIAWAGNATHAVRHLKAEGKRAPTQTTLSEWARGQHADRYQELRSKFSEQLEEQLAHEYRDVARLAADVQRQALEKATGQLKAGKDRDPSRTAANAATVADKMTGKLLALTGRPTSIREDRSLNEVMRSLVAKGVIRMPDEPAQIEAPAEEAA